MLDVFMGVFDSSTIAERGWVGQGDKDIICSYSLVVEQMTVNHQVGGSNPSKSAFKVKKIVIGLAYFSFREAVKL